MDHVSLFYENVPLPDTFLKLNTTSTVSFPFLKPANAAMEDNQTDESYFASD